MTRFTTVEFIQRAREKHGEKYDYSRVCYSGQTEKVEIVCPEHGPFWQVPYSHWRGAGCPICGHQRHSLTCEEFVARANTLHGGKYDYSQMRYVNARTKVKIICPVHGPFWVKANNHLANRSGCPQCAGRLRQIGKGSELQESKRLSQVEFIAAAKARHGDRYDHSRVRYVNSRTKVEVICRLHGPFWVAPTYHLAKGTGCPACGLRPRLSTAEFVARAQMVHGEKYDYELVEYVNNYTKVAIRCPEHGIFYQIPAAHVNGGNGCPACAKPGRPRTREE